MVKRFCVWIPFFLYYSGATLHAIISAWSIATSIVTRFLFSLSLSLHRSIFVPGIQFSLILNSILMNSGLEIHVRCKDIGVKYLVLPLKIFFWSASYAPFASITHCGGWVHWVFGCHIEYPPTNINVSHARACLFWSLRDDTMKRDTLAWVLYAKTTSRCRTVLLITIEKCTHQSHIDYWRNWLRVAQFSWKVEDLEKPVGISRKFY